MKNLITFFTAFVCFIATASAQKTAQIKDVLDAEKGLDRALQQKGIRDGFLTYILSDAIVFKPTAVSAKTYYTDSKKIPGKLVYTPKIARISANGDMAFTAGSYSLTDNGAEYPEYGEYLSVWRTDLEGNLKLAFNMEMPHPEPKLQQIVDFKDPTSFAKKVLNNDPFGSRSIIVTSDKIFNTSLNLSTLSAYKEFLTPDARYFFPGFEPVIGQDKILQFISSQAISIAAQNTGAGRAYSSDLAYSYGKATIKKGDFTSDYNYIRIWEPDKSHKWNILAEILNPIEK